MIEFILGIEYVGMVQFFKVIIVFLAILYSLYYIIMHTEHVIRKIIPTAFSDKIEVVNIFTERKNSKIPVTELEVRWFLQEVMKTHKKEILGVKRIYLMDRPIDCPKNALARYLPHTKEGAIIQIFPLKYDNQRGNYYLNLEGNTRTGYTDQQAKETALFSLGQEIGRHHLYTINKILKGENAEIYTERFAKGLRIVRDYLTTGVQYSNKDNNTNVTTGSTDEFRE